MPLRIIFDCDDVLVNLRAPMADALNLATGQRQCWQAWSSYDLPARYGLSLAAFTAIMSEQRVLEQATLEQGAASAISGLREAGFAIEVWTARAWYPNALEITAEQLCTLGVRASHVRLFGIQECKAAAAFLASDIAGFVDDNPHHVSALLAGGYAGRVLAMDRPWNRGLDLPRCFSLVEAAAIFAPARAAA